ncbi:PLP-dependent aminotransferase family protein [Novosphingobium sp. PP1Y]|uniref:MocR-like pyridoxine biosynthesis transcription factor PdxR n=1 Tax=Novosphingobium sp. PP1Y TaxID=702113 RepID=UPI00020EF362|nr:PLP-dependent aminotransferase family protein [Novosphingobium sp. PP1Y]CCA94005.1 GntR family transcriptional regulator / MocR family aminotransferase [Novosphingobium sp. PP1Y]
MQLPITISVSKDKSLQQQIVDQIRGLIEQNVLRPGDQIPSSREMAELLGLSRRTVVLSYERLIDEGWIETRPGHGTFIYKQLPSQRIRVPSPSCNPNSPAPVLAQIDQPVVGMGLFQAMNERLPYDFRIGRPDAGLFPRNHWRKLASEYLDTFTKTVSDYTQPAGHLLLREAISHHLRIARGIACQPEQVIITAGAQEGLNLVARLMCINNRPVVVEDPCYDGAAQAFSSLGGQLVPVPVAPDGIDTDQLPENGARIAYVTPSHQFPLGVTMANERRAALIAWARKTGTLLVEDDYDSDFRHNSVPIMALQAMGPECAVYLGTFSKSIGPGLRLGYAVFPEHLASSATAVKSILNNGHPWLEQSIMAQFISSGAFEQHLGRMRKNYLDRRNAVITGLAEAFPGTKTSGYEGGMHLVWTTLAEWEPALDLQMKARKLGVGIYSLAGGPTREIVRRPDHDRLLMLGYACLTPDKIRNAITLLKRLIHEPASLSAPMVNG